MSAPIRLCFSFIFLIILLSYKHVDCHDHSHDEPSEAPSLKYSKEANEAAGARGPEVVAKSHRTGGEPGSHLPDDNTHAHHTHSHDGDAHSHGHGSPTKPSGMVQLITVELT